jgi:hypothetical protein
MADGVAERGETPPKGFPDEHAAASRASAVNPESAAVHDRRMHVPAIPWIYDTRARSVATHRSPLRSSAGDRKKVIH